MKIIDKRNPNFNLEKIKNEIEILQQLDHRNIIKIIEYIEDCNYQKKNGKIIKAFIIVMELANKGEVYEYLNTPRTLSEEIVRILFHQLIEGQYTQNSLYIAIIK